MSKLLQVLDQPRQLATSFESAQATTQAPVEQVPHMFIVEAFKKRNQAIQQAIAAEERSFNPVHRLIQRNRNQTGLIGRIIKLILRIWPSLKTRLDKIDEWAKQLDLFPWEGVNDDCQSKIISNLSITELGKMAQTDKSNRRRVASVLLEIAYRLAASLNETSDPLLVALQGLLICPQDEKSLEGNASVIFEFFRDIFNRLPRPLGMKVGEIEGFLREAIDEAKRLEIELSEYGQLLKRAKKCDVSIDEFLQSLEDLASGTVKLEDLSPSFGEDSGACLKAISFSEHEFLCVSGELRWQRDFQKQAFDANPRVYPYLSEGLREEEERALNALQNPLFQFKDLGPQLQQNRIFLRKVLEAKPVLYSSFKALLREDETLALVAIDRDAFNFLFVSDQLKKRDDFQEQAFNANPGIYSYLSEAFRNDRNHALRAVEAGRFNLNEPHKVVQFEFKNLGSALKRDRAFLLEIIKRDPYLYEKIDLAWQEDEEFALLYLDSVYFLFVNLGPGLRSNREFLIKMLESKPESYRDFEEPSREDESLALLAVEKSAFNASHLSQKLLDNRLFLLHMVASFPATYLYLSDALKDDEELALLSIKNQPSNITCVGPNLQDSLSFARKAVKVNPMMYYSVNDSFRKDSEIHKLYKRYINKSFKDFGI